MKKLFVFVLLTAVLALVTPKVGLADVELWKHLTAAAIVTLFIMWAVGRRQFVVSYRNTFSGDPGSVSDEDVLGVMEHLSAEIGKLCIEQEKLWTKGFRSSDEEAKEKAREIKRLKKEWKEAEALALRVSPSLDIPYFDEVEPLRSWKAKSRR